MLDRHSDLPIYAQIEQDLIQQITDGRFPPGAALPSEHSLCERYQVSRMTIRKAVDYLVRRGLVERHRGKGSFIKTTEQQLRIELPLDRHVTSSQVAKTISLPIENELLAFARICAPDEVCQVLDLQQGDEVYHMIRVRRINQCPFVYEQSWMIAAPFPDLDSCHLTTSKYDYLRSKGHPVFGSKKHLKAQLPSQEIRQALGLARDEPVITSRTIAHFVNGQPFELSYIYYNQRYYDFTIEATVTLDE